MAKGTITFTTDNTLQGKIEWSSSSNGSVANTSSVTATLYARRTNNYETYGKSWNGHITIDGNKLSWSSLSSTTTVGNSWVKIKSRTRTITHNQDGTKSITISGAISGPDGTSLASANSTGSGTAKLDNIPRQATITTAENFNDEGNPTITYSNPAGDSVDKIEACIAKEDGSGIYVQYREISKTGTSYTFSLTTDERNTLRQAAKNNTLSVAFYIKTTINGTSITPFSSVVKTLTIINAKPTLSPTIKDTNNTTIALTGDNNKLIKFYSNAQAKTGSTVYKYATVLSETITNSGRTKVTNTATTNAITDSVFTFYIQDSRKNDATSTIDVKQKGNWIEYVKLSCNATPSNPTAEGDMTLNIKGNYWNGNFGAVQNVLTLKYRMGIAESSFGDWITLTPTITNNTYNIDIPISGLDYQTTYSFEVQASDKLATLPVKTFNVQTKTVFDWSNEDFQFNVPVQIDGETTVDGNVNASGKVSGWLSSTVKNLPSGAGDRTYWNSLPNGEYWYSVDITTITEYMPYDYGFVYKTGTFNPGDFSILFSSQPSGKIWRKCGSSVDVTAWKSLVYTSDLYPVGTCYTTSTNTNPSTLGMPGTWTLIDKEFKSQYIYTDDTTYITRTNISDSSARLVVGGHSIIVDMKFVLSTALTDSTLNVLTLKLSSFISDFRNQRYSSGWTDSGNAMVMFSLSNTGILQCMDVIGVDTVASGETCYVNLNIAMSFENMVDSACDKFIWKRTA